MGLFDRLPVIRNLKESYEKQVQELREDIDTIKEETGWDLIGDTDRELTRETRETIQRMAYQKYYKDPSARAIIGGINMFVFGAGIVFQVQDENLIVQETLNAFWRDPDNKMQLRQKEMGRRTLRDGELFLRKFINKNNGQVKVRFVNPKEITNIVTDPNDVEKPLKYIRNYINKDGLSATEKISADEILHIKLHADSDVKRGRSHLEPILKSLTRYKEWLEDRAFLNKMMSHIVAEKIVKGAPAQVRKSAEDIPTRTSGTYTASKKMPKRGTVLVHSEGIEWKWTQGDVKAHAAEADGRALRLDICAGAIVPEFLLSDVSNANYASTMVAENPFVKLCQDLQVFFEVYIKSLFRSVIQAGIKYGKIPEESTITVMKDSYRQELRALEKDLMESAIPVVRKKLQRKIDDIFEQEDLYVQKKVGTSLEVDIQWSTLIHRDLKVETEAYVQHETMGWAHKSTIAGQLGYDYEEEKRKMEREEKEQSYEKRRAAQIQTPEEEGK